uniref:Uncharacterized protein n=1 Tax=Parascaris equorum TaxID=6256 RepID=A0A914RQI3_PAREQ
MVERPANVLAPHILWLLYFGDWSRLRYARAEMARMNVINGEMTVVRGALFEDADAALEDAPRVGDLTLIVRIRGNAIRHAESGARERLQRATEMLDRNERAMNILDCFLAMNNQAEAMEVDDSQRTVPQTQSTATSEIVEAAEHGERSHEALQQSTELGNADGKQRYALVVYQEHVRRVLHRLAHVYHSISDISIDFGSGVPSSSSLRPQCAHYDHSAATEVMLSITFLSPHGGHPGPVASSRHEVINVTRSTSTPAQSAHAVCKTSFITLKLHAR